MTVKVIIFARITHMRTLRTIGNLGELFSISQTESHCEFGRYYGLVHIKAREIPRGY